MDSTQVEAAKGFATGDYVVLRPVLEADLPELAKLLAANPCDDKPLPWTLQRLKQKFEDKDEPGLWGQDDRYYAIVRRAGGLVGFLRERSEGSHNVLWNQLYVSELLPDHDALARDAVAAYLAFKLRWHDPRRIAFELLECQPALAACLTAHGFTLDVVLSRWMIYHGQAQGLALYSWLSEELRRNRADDGPVAGEEV